MRRLCFSLAVVVMLLAGSSALCYPTKVHVDRLAGYYGGLGGEFTLTVVEPAGESGRTFQSFCLEYDEHVNLNTVYDTVVNTAAIGGGSGTGSDPLDPRTAYLYNSFLEGTLSGYDYTAGSGRQSSAVALQEVIWYLEAERPKSWSSGSLQDTFYEAAENSGWTDTGHIRVLNLYQDGKSGQDQLFHTPSPATIVLLAVGFGFVSRPWRRRVSG